MPSFAYVATDGAGRKEEASIEADSRYLALAALRQRGLTATQLTVGGESRFAVEAPAAPAREAQPLLRMRVTRISLSERAVFCRQLAMSVGSGVPLRESLESIAEDIDHPGFRRVLQDVIREIHHGKAFSKAARKHEPIFGRLFVALMRAAEEAGSMPRTLEYLAAALEKSDRLARKIRSIVAYPIFVAVFFLVVCMVMTIFVIPRFQDIFCGNGGQLPLITRVVFGFNKALIANLHIVLLSVAALVVAFQFYRRTARGRSGIDRLKLKIPIFGSILRKLAVARFCRNLAIMLRGGVPIATAMEIASDVCGNDVMKASLLKVRDNVVRGGAFSASLQKEDVFPRLMIRMVKVGESSGQLPAVLEKVAELYEDQVESSMLMATSLLEPVVICVFGVIITCLVLAIYVPVFTASTTVR